MLTLRTRRNISLLLFIGLLLTCAAVWSMGAGEKGLKDGVYSGSAEGFGGPLKVEVTVREGAVTEVAVVEQAETPFIAKKALKEIPAQIVATQTWEVDAVSGATVTSEAIMKAVEDALAP